MEAKTLLANGLDKAFIGYADIHNRPFIAVYDIDKVIEILMEENGMNHEEALEFFYFNIQGAWMGEGTPIFLYKCSLGELEELCNE